MLQIASGKLFKGTPAHRNELRGVLYTNLRMYNRVIDTAAGRLLYTSTLHDSKSLVYEFIEHIEGQPLSHGIDPYMSDFAAIVSFALNVTCTPDQELAFRLLNGRPGPSVHQPPSRLVQRVFDETIFCQDEDANHLVTLVNQLIGLERRSFLGAMRAIRSYVTGLHRLADDYELAYTLLVVSIESLAKEFDDFQPGWQDYDERKRRAIDQALTGADEDVAGQVRTALLETEHVALGRRFREFTLDHLRPSYFREEAQSQVGPMGRSDLVGALRQAYDLRSKYIHNLAELPAMLTVAGRREAVSLPFRRDVLLTFQGLARLARHVITTFIERQPKVEKEEYDYSKERAGIITYEWAPQYWIGDASNLNVALGRDLLEDFLKQIAACLLRESQATVTDLRANLTEVEKMLPQMNAEQRRPFIALYVIFNAMVPNDLRMENHDAIVKNYGHELGAPSTEAMLAFLLLGTVPDWSLIKHQEVHDTYFRRKGRKNVMRVPPALEAGLCLTLAERYRQEDDMERARVLITAAVENYPGHVLLTELEQSFATNVAIDWKHIIVPPHDDTANHADVC